MNGFKRCKNERRTAGQSGQIIVEYLLLLLVAVAVAALLVNGLVSRNPDSPGIIIKKWQQILQVIGSDHAGDIDVQQKK